jgi:transposase
MTQVADHGSSLTGGCGKFGRGTPVLAAKRARGQRLRWVGVHDLAGPLGQVPGGLDPLLTDIHHQGFVPEGCPIMESVGNKPQRHRRAFTPEFKAEIVELCQRGDRSVGQVARDFALTETAVREWVKQAERDMGTHQDGGLTSAEQQELATAFFALMP